MPEIEAPPHPYQEWRVLSVREGKVKPNPRGAGNLQAFYVDFEGVEDHYAAPEGAYWNRKEGNAPKQGDRFWGEINVGEYGLKFAWDNTKPASNDSQPRTPDFKAAAGSSPTGESQDARQASIVRQHSQEMSLRFLVASASSTPRPAPEFTPEWLELHLQPIIDWFVADASGTPTPAKDDAFPPF